MPLIPAESLADLIARALDTPGDDYERRLTLAAKSGAVFGNLQASQVLWRRQQRAGSLAPTRGARLDPACPWESIEQADLADALDAHPARLLWAHIPNERSGRRQAGILASQGVKSGVPDVIIWTPPLFVAGAVGVAIELKRRGATPSSVKPTQRQWLASLQALGWIAVSARGAGPAVALVEALYGPIIAPMHDFCSNDSGPYFRRGSKGSR